MNNQEARFILRAYRPDGQDAGDPLFAEALVQARHDPALRRWLEREQAVDTEISRALCTVAPPPALRETILMGARAGRTQRAWWREPVWLSAAALLVILASVGGWWFNRSVSRPVGGELASFLLRDVAEHGPEHTGHQPALAAIQSALEESGSHLAARASALQLPAHGCRTIHFAGREIFEVCFERNGAWYHLYVTRSAADDGFTGEPRFVGEGKVVAATWVAGQHSYALVASNGAEALRRLL
jgi:hypothetical protein